MEKYPGLSLTSKILLGSLIFTAALSAQENDRTTLALWTFEEWEADAPRGQSLDPIAPEIGSGAVTGWHANESSWSTRIGNGSENSLNSTNWQEGDYYQFETDTTGFESIHFEFHIARSSTAPEVWLFSYSSDGLNFTDHAATFKPPAAEWKKTSTSPGSIFNYELDGISSIENHATVFFRLSAMEDGRAASGAARVDNISITGTPIPEPATVALIGGLSALGLASALRRRSRN